MAVVSDGEEAVARAQFKKLGWGEELFELIHRCRRLSEAEARHHLRQILTGVARIHQRGWAHRDLKLENVIAVRGGGTPAGRPMPAMPFLALISGVVLKQSSKNERARM